MKNRDLNHLDVLPASWTDGIQEFISPLAEGLKLSIPAANQLRVEAAAGNDQVALGVNGLWRYNSADVTVTHPAGNAGVVHSVYVVASANQFTPPDTDTTDYSFGVQILPGATVPSGSHGGRAIVAYRKVAETDWDGSNITGLRRVRGSDDQRTYTALAPWATVPAATVKAAASQTANVFQVLTSADALRFAIDGNGAGMFRRAATGDTALTVAVTGDAQPRLRINADGSIALGSGSVAPDWIIKYGEFQGDFKVVRAAVGDNALSTAITGDSQRRLAITAGGTLQWGSGLAVADTNLYRDPAGNKLVSDDEIQAATLRSLGDIVAQSGGASQVEIGAIPSGAGIAIGTAGDSEIVRSAANHLFTPDKLQVGGELELDGALNHDGTQIGFYGVAPAAQSTGWGTFTLSTGTVAGTRKTLAQTYTDDHVVEVLNTVVAALKSVGILA